MQVCLELLPLQTLSLRNIKSDAMLGLKVASGHTIESVSARLAACSEVIYILWVSGRYDLLIEIVSDDRNAFFTIFG